jgi:dUTP pyrophosphatase
MDGSLADSIAKDSHRILPITRIKRRNMKFKIEENGFLPVREHTRDAGIDLRTPIKVVIYPHSSTHVDLRIRVEIPEGYVGLLTSKSGLMRNRGLKTTGTIDSGYSGTIGCTIFNHSDEIVYLERGDKVTQLVVMPCLTDQVEIVGEIVGGDRGENGYGSTGD